MIGNKKRYALITGASSGIGYEMAKLFAKGGKNIVVVARNSKRLEDFKREVENKYGTKVRTLPIDLSDPKAVLEIFSELEKGNIEVDVLVNNAGYGVYGMFYKTELQKELDMIQVNVISLVHLTKLFLRKMLEYKYGRILNVGSTGSFLPVPLEAAYGGSKAFVLSFSEALANELKGTCVSVTCLCPGFTDTGFYERAVGKAPNMNKKRLMMNAVTVAKVGYTSLEKGKAFVLPGLLNKSIPIWVRLIPRSWLLRMSRWALEHA